MMIPAVAMAVVVITTIPVIAVVVTVALVATVALVMVAAMPLPFTIVDVVAAATFVHLRLPKHRAAERPAIEPLAIGVHDNHPVAGPSPPAMSALHPLDHDDFRTHHSAGAIP